MEVETSRRLRVAAKPTRDAASRLMPLAPVCVLVIGVDALTYYRCRDANPHGQYFTMDECPAGQVMDIVSAVTGFSIWYNRFTSPPRCGWNECTRPTGVPAELCNGRRTCRISQQILIYPRRAIDAVCDLVRVGTFIRIEFTCVPGTAFLLSAT